MKKKLISLLLILVLVISVTAISVMAEEQTTPAEHKHCVCGNWCDGRGDHDCDSLEKITWTAFSLELCEVLSDGRLAIPAGNYYLAENLSTDKAFVIMPNTEVSICLNGKTLESSARVFRVHGILNIAECTNGTGKVVGNNGGQAPVFYVGAHGHINHYRGILRAKEDSKNYAGVGAVANDILEIGGITERASGSYTMYGGTIDASKVTLTKDKDGKNGSGGAVMIFGSADAPCSFTMYGGTMRGAKSVETNGATINVPATATVKFMGGTIESGKASGLGNGIYVTKGADCTVGGKAAIEDLYIPGDGIINVENLTGSVGITRSWNAYSVFANCDTADSAAHLTSNVDGRPLSVTEVEGKFQVALANHGDHCVCGGNLTGEAAIAAHEASCTVSENWIGLNADNLYTYLVASDTADGGNEGYYMFADEYDDACFYLEESITMGKPIEIHNGDNVSLCLNGYTFTYKKGMKLSAFRVWGNLNLCDCTGRGKATTNNDNSGGLIYLHDNKATADFAVNIYGGTYTATDNNTTQNGGVISVGNANAATTINATLNIYGGTITGGTGTLGGNIYINQNKSAAGRVSLNIYGGSITNGTACTRGGNVYVNMGYFTMYGGTMTGGTLVAGVNSSGAAVTPEFGADFGCAANKPMSAKLDGKVTIGEIGAYGSASDSFAIELGDNFSATSPIKVTAKNADKVIKSAKYADLAYLVSGNEAYQLTCEGVYIFVRDAALDYHCRCGGNMTEAAKTYIKHTNCSDILWTDLTQAVIDGLEVQTGDALGDTISILPAGNYKLVEDITCANSLTVAADATVNLDLNGHTLTAAATAKRAVLARGNLNISDSAYNPADENAVWGKIVGSNTKNAGHSLYVGAASESRLYGGEITSAFTEASVGGPVGIGGKFHMAGGKITGLTKTSSNGGAMILNDSANVTLWGGIVTGGEANRGGAIYVSKANQSLSIRGDAQIIGGSAKQGGNIYALGNVSVDEEAVISGGIAFSGTIDKKSVGGGGNIYSEASVYVKGGQIIGGQATRKNSEPAYGGNIYLNKADATEIVKITGGVIADGSAPTGGNIFCRSSFEMTGGTVSGGVATSAMAGNIRLEGSSKDPVFTITGGEIKDGTSAQQGANLVIRNSSEAVVIKNASFLNGNCTAHHGGNVYITGQLNSVEMENVTISGGKAFNRAGNLYIMGSADLEVAPVITLTNCVITDGVAGSRGGNIYMGDVNATLNNCTVTGGSIVEGTEKDPFEMYGYNLATNFGNYETYITIKGGTYTGAGENNLSSSGVHVLSGDTACEMTLAGAPVIENLRIGTNRMINVDGLTEGASIGVSRFEITGLFAPGASADKAAYFYATQDGTSVSAAEEGLRLNSEYAYWAFTAGHKGLSGAATITEALQIDGAAMIKMTKDFETNETVEGNLCLDLNGYDLSGLTVNGNLYVVDYKTNKFEENVAGSLSNLTVSGVINGGKVAFKANSVENFNTSNTYVLVKDEGVYSLHRIAVEITHTSLDCNNDAIGFKATVYGDAAAQAAVTGFGFNMGVEGGKMKTYTVDGHYGEDGVFTLRVKGIMAANGGAMNIIGEAFLLFGNEQVVSAKEATTSMKTAIEAINSDISIYSDAQMSAVKSFVEANIAKMEGWATGNITAWAPAAEPETPAA